MSVARYGLSYFSVDPQVHHFGVVGDSHVLWRVLNGCAVLPYGDIILLRKIEILQERLAHSAVRDALRIPSGQTPLASKETAIWCVYRSVLVTHGGLARLRAAGHEGSALRGCPDASSHSRAVLAGVGRDSRA